MDSKVDSLTLCFPYTAAAAQSSVHSVRHGSVVMGQVSGPAPAGASHVLVVSHCEAGTVTCQAVRGPTYLYMPSQVNIKDKYLQLQH